MFTNLNLIKNGEPLYKQLSNYIEGLIIDNKLKDGDKLPTIRSLSTLLNVNNVTVINAYKNLEKDGYLEKKVGSGSYIKKISKEYSTGYMDFSGRDSNIDSFPLEEINHSIGCILKEDGVNTFKYEDTRGNPELKKSLASYFKEYSIHTDPDLIQIVSGGQQALDIISKTLLNFGDTVFTEEPTYRGAIESFSNREARIIELQLESDGLNILDLESKIVTRKPALLYLMTFNQKPTGFNYSLKKKEEILRLALKYNFYIIEDDQGSELSYSNSKTLKSMDKHDRVIYIKSFTPLFMPGLRLGCLIPPQSLYNKLASSKLSTDISTPGLLQRSFAHYLNKNSWLNYYKQLKEIKLKKIELVNNILQNDFSELLEFNTISNSGSYWLRIKKGDGETLLKNCITKNVEFMPGSAISREYRNYFRLNISSIPYENIINGLNIIKDELLKLSSNYHLQYNEAILHQRF